MGYFLHLFCWTGHSYDLLLHKVCAERIKGINPPVYDEPGIDKVLLNSNVKNHEGGVL